MTELPAWVGPRLADHVAQIRKRPAQQLDYVGMLTGPEGSGKSTLSAHLAALLDPTFLDDPLSRFCYTGKDFIRLGEELEPGQVRIFDEGDDGLLSQEFMTADNKGVLKHLFRCRELRVFSLINIPHVRWMAPIVKEHRAQDWYLLPRRGSALVHQMRRADYDGVKPSWRKMFGLNFPEPAWPWWPDYRQAKRDRIRGIEPDGEAAVADEGDGWITPAAREIERLAQSFHALELVQA